MSYQSSTPYLKKASLSEKFGPNSPNRTSVPNQSRSQSRGKYSRSDKRHDLLRGDNQKKTFRVRVKLVMAFLKAKETIENFVYKTLLQTAKIPTSTMKLTLDSKRSERFFTIMSNPQMMQK